MVINDRSTVRSARFSLARTKAKASRYLEKADFRFGARLDRPIFRHSGGRAPKGADRLSMDFGERQTGKERFFACRVVGQCELTHYPPETSAMKPATKRW